MSVILKAENISKQYRLGLVGTGSFTHDVNRWWHAIRGKEDPYLKVGALNDRSMKTSEEYVWALQDINFEVKDGEVLGIIGKNGAGKSTLLKLLSRVTSPTTGVIKTKGRIASLLEVGTGFHPELTGKENIFLNGAILGMNKSEIAERLEEIIEFSGCEMYIDTPVKRYSSGMRVRLAFAVAAHLEPDILVIDEVLAVGDAEFQKKAIGKMQDISKGEGRTVLFVSHNMVSVQQLCTRCILMENGRIKTEGPTQEIIDEYLKLNDETDSFKRTENTALSPVFIKDVYLLSPKKIKTNKVQCGHELNIFIEISASEEQGNIRMEIGIDGKRGERLVYLSNALIERKLTLNSGVNIVQVHIDKVPFLPGTYPLTIRISNESGKEVDKVQNNFKIQVEEGDFFNTGKLNVLSKSKFLMEHDIFKI
ncbi:ABC transporter ATP-binding protein [Cochleicola gelatinilyticus]|uniref:ABC transporter ATP-binding protein n=1 Tax=Cochleicola gelatinilyticus TaxID=1763537 RepID=A0A167EPM7_9FLAO|nr:ABC transporter ATP-binding protein [Cochleicola gelatinilyticus]OAB75750.1 ABC transporter ATP-binding protein [Cochleicola gelatinilyticus]